MLVAEPSSIQKLGSDGVPKPDVLSVSYGATEAAFGSAHALSLCAQSEPLSICAGLVTDSLSGYHRLEWDHSCRMHWG